MAQKFLTLCQAESRRLIWIIVLMFSLILVFQYFELPYGNFLPSLIPAGKVPELRESSLQNGDLPPKSKIIGNVSLSSASNYTDIENDTRFSGSASEGNDGSEGSLDLDVDNTDGKETSPKNLDKQNETVKPENVKLVDDKLPKEEARQPEQSLNGTINAKYNNSSTGRVGKETTITTSDQVGSSVDVIPSPSPVILSANSSTYIPANVLDGSISTPAIPGKSNTSLVEKNSTITSEKNEKSETVHVDLKQKDNSSSMTAVPKKRNRPEMPMLDAYSLSDMNNLLLQSQASYYSVIPQWSSAVDHELQDVTSQIENAPIVQNDPNLYAPLYRNVSTFRRSYELMEQILKVYIYKEGERPILHTPVLRGLYASEGWFMKQLEGYRHFVTKNPKKAHLFYLPFSSRMLEETLYVPNSHNHKNLVQYLKNYLDMITAKYPFWNRTGGADHFLVACHDWAPSETKEYMAKCIRALCNADVKEGFVFGKDVSLPETYIQLPKTPLKNLGGKPLSKRSTLAFFAGSMHGYLRPILLQHWENKDPDMKIFGRLPKKKDNKNYVNYMKTSKYCICAKGFEVNSPRVVEAIFYECVPVIISDNFVPPFFEVLNWESFAVFVLEKDIPNLKKILLSIPEKRYRQMQMMVKRVQQHFLWHPKPVKYDIFHMILHSIWYNRLHQIRPL